MNGTRLISLILGIMTSLLVVGTAGYLIIEKDWSIIDAFYMTVITISTVGFGEVKGLSTYGRLFTVVLILAGIVSVSLIGTYAARLMVDTSLVAIFGGKHMRNVIDRLTDHYVLCGYGRMGSIIATELKKADLNLVIIEKDDNLVQAAQDSGYLVVKGDATCDSVLRQAGIERAKGVIAVLNSDADNLFISLAAREINPSIQIIARGEEPGTESRLLRAGADVVVSPLKLGGMQIARMVLERHLIDEPATT